MKRWGFRFQREFRWRVAYASLFLTTAANFINFELNYLAENRKCIIRSAFPGKFGLEYWVYARALELCGLFCNYLWYIIGNIHEHAERRSEGNLASNSTAMILSLLCIIIGALNEPLHMLCQYRTPPMFNVKSVLFAKRASTNWLPVVISGLIYSILMT